MINVFLFNYDSRIKYKNIFFLEAKFGRKIGIFSLALKKNILHCESWREIEVFGIN